MTPFTRGGTSAQVSMMNELIATEPALHLGSCCIRILSLKRIFTPEAFRVLQHKCRNIPKAPLSKA